jgi:NADPH:quinone reductase-like Zn-dependent oxidoreductase
MSSNAVLETKTMAVRIHSFGGPESLELEEVVLPAPGPGEVLVRVRAAGVNPADWKMREGLCGEHPMPRTLGGDFSGTVEALGPGVSDFSLGQPVFGHSDFGGAFAGLTVAPATSLVAKPSPLGDIEAAATPLCGLAAWQALVDIVAVHAGQRILIHGGAGGVGMFAVQLAVRQGAYVIATSSARNLSFLRQLGAQQVIDHTSTPFEEVVKNIDVVLDLVGGETQERSWKVLKSGGRLVSTVSLPSQNKALLCGVRAQLLQVRTSADELAMVGDLVANGEIRVLVEKVLPWFRAPEALEMNRCGHARGKIVLTFDPALN